MAGLKHQRESEEIRALRARVTELELKLGGKDATGVSAKEVIAGLFDQPLVMVVIADLIEGRFVRINKKLCDVLGYTEQELLESSFLDRVHPDDHLATMREMERLVAGEQTIDFRNRHRAADGSWRIFEWTATVDPDRELCYALAVDVTDEG